MKKLFKLMSIALLSCSLVLVACGKDENDDQNNSNNNNNNNEEVTNFKITLNCDASMGSVSITPQKDTYEADEEVTITATPNSGYTFVNWTGAETITNNPYTFKVSGNATYTANFEANPQASYSASFDGEVLDIAGYSDFQTNGEGVYLLQFAKSSEGNTVYFPYITMWMQGNETSNFAVSEDYGAVELYYETYYTAGQNQYGDWQYYATNNINCTRLDMTSLTVSFTGSFKMFSLGDIVNQVAEDAEGCEKKDLSVTVENAVFTIPSSKGLRKMNVK